jgi:hypothetical protein
MAGNRLLRTKFSCKLLAASVLVLFLGGNGNAASFKSVSTKENKTIISLTGDIVDGDAEALRLAIQSANDTGKLVSAVRLASPGGLLIEAVKIADIVRYAKVATSVPNNAVCASACFVIFAAGSNKFASYTAQVGVHGASGEDGRETVGSGAATVTMARVVKELGVPTTIIGKMVVTPPEQMVWLTPDELRSMGTTMTGKPSQVAQPPSDVPLSIDPSARAGTPVQTLPPARAVEKAPPTWNEMVDTALNASRQQNGGTADTRRNCQPELKVCNIAIFFRMKDSTEAMIRRTEDVNGKIVSRDFCTFNKYGDVRSCLDWDTGKSRRSMKNAKGEWHIVEEE